MPRKFDPERQAQAERLKAKGLTTAQIAACCGVSERTIQYCLSADQRQRRAEYHRRLRRERRFMVVAASALAEDARAHL